MSVPFLITYDNRSPRNYQPLYQLLQSWGAVRLAESVWLVELNIDAITAVRSLLTKLEFDDLVAVVELRRDGNWAANRASGPASNWLSHNISQAVAA